MKRMPYQIGYDHGFHGRKMYSHRVSGKAYDSAHRRESYNRGYGDGAKKRAELIVTPKRTIK